MTHTPTPWTYNDKRFPVDYKESNQGVWLSNEDWKYALKRVNAHDELVNAIQLAMATIARLDSDGSSTGGTMDVCTAALAKVTV